MAMKMVVVAAVAVLLMQCITAEMITVGGDAMWKVPGSADYYSVWAAKQTFGKGDSLVFKFSESSHTVAEVSKEAYDSCNTDNALKLHTTPPTEIPLTKDGVYYFICTIGSHCKMGQKLTVTVGSSPASSASPDSPPPPKGSSASTAIASIFFSVIGLVMAFLS